VADTLFDNPAHLVLEGETVMRRLASLVLPLLNLLFPGVSTPHLVLEPEARRLHIFTSGISIRHMQRVPQSAIHEMADTLTASHRTSLYSPRPKRPVNATRCSKTSARRRLDYGLRMSSVRMMPTGTVNARAPRKSERRSRRTVGLITGRIHRSGTSRKTRRCRRTRVTISRSSQLSIAASTPLRIGRG
jgi:hypothetical protein